MKGKSFCIFFHLPVNLIEGGGSEQSSIATFSTILSHVEFNFFVKKTLVNQPLIYNLLLLFYFLVFETNREIVALNHFDPR